MYYLFTTPNQVSFYHHLSSLYPFPPVLLVRAMSTLLCWHFPNVLLLLYSELCHTFCRFIPLKISAVSWVQSSPPFLTSTKIHRLYPFHLCKHTFPSPLLPFFAFLVYFSKLRMCEPLPNASNSNSFLTSLSRFVFFSLTHTSSPFPYVKNFYHVLDVLSPPINIVFNVSRYYALWSIIANLNYFQSMSWNSLCFHAFMLLSLPVDLLFPSPPTYKWWYSGKLRRHLSHEVFCFVLCGFCFFHSKQ